MTDQTPLQRLDDAVHDFFTAIDADGTLAGWALVYQAQQIADEGPEVDPLQWRNGYAIAPGLSDYAAIGLLDVVHEHIRLIGVELLRADDSTPPDQTDFP